MSSSPLTTAAKLSYLQVLCANFLEELSEFFKDGSKFAVIGHHPSLTKAALIVTDDTFESLSAVCLRMATASPDSSSPPSHERVTERQYAWQMLDEALNSIRHKFIPGTKFAVVVDIPVAGSKGIVITEMDWHRVRQIVSQHP